VVWCQSLAGLSGDAGLTGDPGLGALTGAIIGDGADSWSLLEVTSLPVSRTMRMKIR
jgi:hypothetical protein